jgi:hypothetical protein
MIRVVIIFLCLNLVKLQDSLEFIKGPERISNIDNSEVNSTTPTEMPFDIEAWDEFCRLVEQHNRELEREENERKINWINENEETPTRRTIIIPVGAIFALIIAIVKCLFKNRDPSPNLNECSVGKDDDEISSV